MTLTPVEDRIAVRVLTRDEPARAPRRPVMSPQPTSRPSSGRRQWYRRRANVLAFVSVAAPALVLRVWQLNAIGINSDEAVYAGQAASIAGDAQLLPYFPIFRAHPLLFQTALSLLYGGNGVSDLAGRLFAVAFGLGTVALTYLLGRELYGRRAGYVAALLVALMPYHVVVSRQILLDGPMTFFATLSLFLLARFRATERTVYLYACAGTLGLTFLSKEPSIVFLGAVYAFLALSWISVVKLRQVVLATAVFTIVILPFPLSVLFSGRSSTGQQFLSYQIFRRPNHTWTFYPAEVPPAIGVLVLLAAGIGLVVLRRYRSWRETLLLSWIVVPFVFFELWPVKGFQYLLPIAVPVAVLGARALASIGQPTDGSAGQSRTPWLFAVAVAMTALSLAVPTWQRIQPASGGSTFLAGSGGVPGGREAGEWVGGNVPVGAQMLAVGPSMANIIQFYGDRKVFGLSVSLNPLHRNPVYEPVTNPDHMIRTNELQYLIWDSYSASRTTFFSDKLLRYVERYHGRVIHTEFVTVTSAAGQPVQQPTIVIYEVRP